MKLPFAEHLASIDAVKRIAALITGLILSTACGSSTPAADWSDAERLKISGEFPNCEFGEDPQRDTAGFTCELGSFLAHNLPEPGPADAMTWLANQHAEQPFTAPLEQVKERETLTVGEIEFRVAIATYKPKPDTIVPPEVVTFLAPAKGGSRRAYSCAVSVIAALDTEEAIASRMAACLKGVRLLLDASR